MRDTSTPDPTRRLLFAALLVCWREHPSQLSRRWSYMRLCDLSTEDCEYTGPATPDNYRLTCPYREPAIECGPCMAAQALMGGDNDVLLRMGGVYD